MPTKEIKGRIVLKHDTAANWKIAGDNGFCPLANEIIMFDPDDSCAMIRYKIGRWTNETKTELVNINDLPFESNVYVGRDEPVNAPAGFIWVDTSDEEVEIVEERLEGDGQEFYTTAPSTLSFRSTAPLNELQEVQINGETIDSSNYELEEGSTIVILPYRYLSDFNDGEYNLSVKSNNKIANGNFTVASPELNEYGFYYNVPYYGFVNISYSPEESGPSSGGPGSEGPESGGSSSGGKIEMIGSFCFVCYEGGYGTWISMEKNFPMSELTMIIRNGTVSFTKGNITFSGSFSEDGKQFIGSNTRIDGMYSLPGVNFNLTLSMGASDEKCSYIHDEVNKNGWIVFSNRKDLSSVEITSSILDEPVTTIGEEGFIGQRITSLYLPSGLTSIGAYAFYNCSSLTNITFKGTIAQWNTITKGSNWHGGAAASLRVPATHVHCVDGDVALN